LTFVAGDALEGFNVTLCGDSLVEGTETVTLTLSSPTGGATLGSPNPATLNIEDVATQFCNTDGISIPATGTSPVAASPYPSAYITYICDKIKPYPPHDQKIELIFLIT
jgi:hypothetical protein